MKFFRLSMKSALKDEYLFSFKDCLNCVNLCMHINLGAGENSRKLKRRKLSRNRRLIVQAVTKMIGE